MKVLEAADLDAREHLAFADVLQNQVVDALHSSGTRLEGVRKKHHTFAGRLLQERDRAYDQRDKSKQASLCHGIALEGMLNLMRHELEILRRLQRSRNSPAEEDKC